MERYINKSDLLTKIEKRLHKYEKEYEELAHYEVWITAKEIEQRIQGLKEALSILNAIEVKEVDLEKESELIANGIMISVQSNKYGTNIYNAKRNDFNHHHLQMAARKGIELGLKAKGE